jgi:sugar-specific transcriptional regulator TrmB
MVAELKELARELEPLLRHLPDARQIEKVNRMVAQYAAKAADAVTPDFSAMSAKLDKAIRQAIKQIKRNYPRNSAPYKLAAAYERHGLPAALRMLAQIVEEQIEMRKNSMVQMTGDYANVLKNSVPQEWAAKVKSAAARGSEALINNDFSAAVGQMMADSSKVTADQLQRLLKKVSDELNKRIQSNKDVQGILKFIREVIEEIRRELKNVDTKNISDLSREAVKLLASPEAWASHARVLTWNPNDGEVVVELRAPVDMRQVKSLWASPKANLTKGYNTMASRFAQLSKADWVGQRAHKTRQ